MSEDRARWMGSNSPPCTSCGQPVDAGQEIVTTIFDGGWSVRHVDCDNPDAV